MVGRGEADAVGRAIFSQQALQGCWDGGWQSRRTSFMASIIFLAASWSGQRTMLLSTSSIVKVARSTLESTSRTEFTKPRICTSEREVS